MHQSLGLYFLPSMQVQQYWFLIHSWPIWVFFIGPTEGLADKVQEVSDLQQYTAAQYRKLICCLMQLSRQYIIFKVARVKCVCKQSWHSFRPFFPTPLVIKPRKGFESSSQISILASLGWRAIVGWVNSKCSQTPQKTAQDEGTREMMPTLFLILPFFKAVWHFCKLQSWWCNAPQILWSVISQLRIVLLLLCFQCLTQRQVQ